MKTPEDDVERRYAIWDSMQMLWMDINIDDEIESISRICANSEYSLNQIKEIYWNEVLPAVSPNLNQVIPEWTGYKKEDLIKLVLNSHRFGKKVPSLNHNPFYAARNWKKIEKEIVRIMQSEKRYNK